MLRKVALALAVTASVSGLAACGGSSKETTTAAQTTTAAAAQTTTAAAAQTTAAAQATTAAAAAQTAGGTLEDFMKTAEGEQLKSSFDAMSSSLGSNGSLDVSAKGNELIVVFKFGSDIPTTGMKEALVSALEQQAPTFEAQADAIKAGIGSSDKVLFTVKYLDANNGELAVKTFSSK